jgi:hypothetical protein
LEGFHGTCRVTVSFPARPLFLSAFRRFSLGGLILHESARAVRTVLMRSNNRIPLGNCDSPGLETSPDYLTQLGAASHRSSLPSPSFAYGTRERARGTGEFCLLRPLRNGFRGAGPTSLTRLFPSRLGLSWNGQLNLSTFTARSVLSMNCEHHNANHESDNELICTPCSPESAGEKHVSNARKPMKSMLPAFSPRPLFTAFLTLNSDGEKVCVLEFKKYRAVQGTNNAAQTQSRFLCFAFLPQDDLDIANGNDHLNLEEAKTAAKKTLLAPG